MVCASRLGVHWRTREREGLADDRSGPWRHRVEDPGGSCRRVPCRRPDRIAGSASCLTRLALRARPILPQKWPKALHIATGFFSTSRIHHPSPPTTSCRIVLSLLPVQSMIDVGCGVGTWHGAVFALPPGRTDGLDVPSLATLRHDAATDPSDAHCPVPLGGRHGGGNRQCVQPAARGVPRFYLRPCPPGNVLRFHPTAREPVLHSSPQPARGCGLDAGAPPGQAL